MEQDLYAKHDTQNKQNIYHNIDELIRMIDEPARAGCYRMLEDNMELFSKSYGSKNNHQSWPGGYLQHLEETMNIAVKIYPVMESLRPLDFTLSDALLSLYLHDLEKPWKYESIDGKLQIKAEMRDKRYIKEFTTQKMHEYGMTLTAKQQNGIDYAEGEHDWTPGKRSMLPLAAFVHMCDIASARIWHDHPRKEDDGWKT